MKYEALTKDRENKTYGIYNHDMKAFQFINDWNGTETINLEVAIEKAKDLNFLSLVQTWVKAFQRTLPTISQQKNRLKELQTWDKPREDNQLEHRAKKQALIKLTAQY